MDIYSPQKRSEIMRRVRGKNTNPEIAVRKILHSLGFRFRLHQKKLPGKPDILLPRYKKVVFVNGCFWHGHENCLRAKLPATRTEFWTAKIAVNKRRDAEAIVRLAAMGYSVLTVWTCQVKDRTVLSEKLQTFIRG